MGDFKEVWWKIMNCLNIKLKDGLLMNTVINVVQWGEGGGRSLELPDDSGSP